MRVPLWLKLAYTAWFAVWVVTYWRLVGAVNFLWLCDVALFVLLVALWTESPLLFSSQATGVLVIQGVWIVDVAARLALGFHPIGGTEYMFDPAEPIGVRALSLFHLWVPILILWALWRLGYDRRGWKLQTLFAWMVLPPSLLTDPTLNINWMWRPFGIEQTWLPPAVYMLSTLVLYPLLLFWPTHLVLARWMPPRSAVAD